MMILEILALWLVVVLVSMLIVAFLAHRWGHDPFGFMLLTAALGPLAIVALVGTRHREQGIAASVAPSRTSTGRPYVVIACDGSDSGRIAAEFVARSHGANSDIVLLIVEGHEAEPRTPAEESQQKMRIDTLTAGAVGALRDAGLSAQTVVVHGNPGEEIVRFAEREKASLVVLGRRGAGLSRSLLGSVSDYVVKNAKAPVAIVS
jgi:nucleotide-binding universal stress UspA family protein